MSLKDSVTVSDKDQLQATVTGLRTRERPILFSGPMVRSILAGEKTQTRRVMKPQPPEDSESFVIGPYAPTGVSSLGYEYPLDEEVFGASTHDGEWAIKCPFGAPRDRLWVRETFRVGAWRESGGLVALDYRASPEANRTPWLDAGEAFTKIWQESTDDAAEAITAGRGSACSTNGGEDFKWDRGDSPCRWRPSIFMPRWASRITLEVTDVRVERLQAISVEDCIAEGLSTQLRENEAVCDLRDQYRELWNSLNAKRGFGWDKNPWVWIVEFRRVES